MPLAAAIAAGAVVAGTGINAYSQGRMNRKSIQYNVALYNQQRKDALLDWTRQTEYDSPTSQMARLRTAGLNPNLVYDSGGAIQPSPAVRSTEGKPWTPHAPQVDTSQIGESVSRIYDVKNKEAQTDNLKAIHTNILEQTLLIVAQRRKLEIETPGIQQDIDIKSEGRPYDLQSKIIKVQQDLANVKYTLSSEERAVAQNTQTIKESVQRIISMQIANSKVPHEIKNLEQILKNLQHDEVIKALDAKLAGEGIRPQDDYKWRLIQKVINDLKDAPPVKIPKLELKKPLTGRPTTWQDSIKKERSWRE